MSDIWDEFEKIAVAQGLVVEAEESQHKTPVRYDSLSDDAIRMLYNIEPETIFKNKDIIETAHPETAVVTRTYDAMNAVIENVNQRQDIMAHIALKTPDGHLTYRRYVAAKQELLNSLIRAAFTLDNQDDEKLMAFADSCAVRLEKKKLVKEAVFPFFLIGGAAALLGAGYYAFYGAESVKNVYVNSQGVLEALRPLMGKPYAGNIYSQVSSLMNEAHNIYPLFPKLRKIRSAQDSVSAAKGAGEAQIKAIEERIQAWMTKLQDIQMKIPAWVDEVNETEELSTEDEGTGIWSRIKNIADPFYDTSAEKLVGALQGRSNLLDDGTSGGLQDAVAKDFNIASRALNAGMQQQQNIKQTLEQEHQAEQVQQPQQIAPSGLPKFEPVPAPEPSMPQGGVARKNPEVQTGFDPTANTWE